MRRLLNFILQNRGFFTFVALELTCIWLIVNNNSYQGASFFNSANAATARVLTVSQNVNNYLSLRAVNKELAEENTRLRQALEAKLAPMAVDCTLLKKYDYVTANVVNNSVNLFRNYVTLDKGRAAGIEPGMAVINSNKVVGKIKTVSENYSVVISLINIDENVSATLKRTGNFGSVKWNAADPHFTTLQFIPRHVVPLPGDSIVTSGLNAVFPPNVIIGTITRTNLTPNELFWEIKVELAQDFTRLQHVEVIRSLHRNEIDSLQSLTIDIRR